MFGRLKSIAKNISSIDPNKMVEEIIELESVQSQLIDLNQSQMMNQGVDSRGDTLGDYSQISITKYGKQPGHITLHDTGEFYHSMKVLTGSDGFLISGDTVKDDTDLADRYPYALGLDSESVSYILPEVTERLREKILIQALK